MPPRCSNMELLRILAMLMVMVLHADFETLGYPRPSVVCAEPLGWLGMIFTEEACICCVDVFVLITGWFGVHFKWRNFLRLCFLAFFTAGLMSALLWICRGKAPGTAFEMLRASWTYWFVCSYLVLYLFTPSLNAFVEKTDGRSLGRFLMGFYLFVIPFSYALSDLERGFTAVSLMGLYLLGRHLRLHVAPRLQAVPRSRFLWTYAALVVVMTLAYWAHIYFRNPWFPHLPSILTSYTNPLCIACAACLVLYFSRLSFHSRTVNWLAAGSLCAYLTHQQIFMRPLYFGTLRDIDAALPSPLYPLGAADFIAVIFLLSVCIGHFGTWCFEKLTQLKPIFHLETLLKKLSL